jgi:hypothetical protein
MKNFASRRVKLPHILYLTTIESIDVFITSLDDGSLLIGSELRLLLSLLSLLAFFLLEPTLLPILGCMSTQEIAEVFFSLEPFVVEGKDYSLTQFADL